MHFALHASGGDQLLVTPQQGLDISDRTIHELFFGPGTFQYSTAPGPVIFAPDEAAHMRDVRVVLYGFLLLALASTVFVVTSLVRRPRDAARWSAVARGGIWLIVAMIVIGLFAFFAFDTVFLLFHEIFFPGGNFSFPDNSNLIRLYPEPFWELTSAALGTLAISGGLVVWFLARRRARALA
jgi:integral membrane protein (TIGR01906 family)